MEQHTPTQERPALGRRRMLMRGALAAPALMTVCTGAGATMATASNLRCLTNATHNPTPAAVGITGSAGDSFMRVRLWKYSVQVKDANNQWVWQDQFYVRGSDLQLLTTTGSGVPGHSQFLRINPSTWQPVGSPGALPTSAKSPALSNHWVAARFDGTGKLVAFGADNKGAMVGASCWNSVAFYVKP
jgi:hypothetical protein